MDKHHSSLCRKNISREFRPLRHAGQSIEEEINSIKIDKILFYAIVPVWFTTMTVIIWLEHALNTRQNPIIWTIIAIVSAGIATRKIMSSNSRIERLKQGLRGEQEVAEILEQFTMEDKYIVLHDIPTGKGNIDHVMVTPKGIFSIETKNITKTNRHDGKIHFHGDDLTIDGQKNESHVTQAIAERLWLKNKLKELTGRDFSTRAVLLYPGWYVDGMDEHRTKGDTWAFKPENLHLYTKKMPNVVKPEDVSLAAHAIKNLIRTQKINQPPSSE